MPPIATPHAAGPADAVARRATGAAARRTTDAAARRTPDAASGERGQAALLLLGLLLAACIGAVVLGGIARGIGARGDLQQAADLAALAAARAMHDAYPRVFAPATGDGPHLERSEYLALATRAARRTAARNGAKDVAVAFPGGGLAPVRVRVTVRDRIDLSGDTHVANTATAEAELAPPGTLPGDAPVNAGEYRGPFATRQGKPMRPDVALAFDRMAAAAHADGVDLIINSAFRSDAEQARLFAQHPDPKWVAPPGRSLHRLGTELDLGPPSAYGWLARNGERFHFVKRYEWEPWHWGLALNAGSTSLGYGAADGERSRTLQDFVPQRFAAAISRAAQRWSVSGALLAAQLYVESHFNPFARSPAGALGIAQFMPDTAAAYGLDAPFDADRSIDAQAHLMRDLLRAFGAVPLALAAYNAGAQPVRACGCVPAIPETQAYVANILGLLDGAGDPNGQGAGALEIRLVR
jgi:hypothetical protein